MENLPEVLFGVHLHRWIVTYPLDKVIRPLNNWGQICTCINCFYSKGTYFTLTICLINFSSSFENLNGNLGFAVVVNVLLSIKRFFKQEKSLPKQRTVTF